MLKRQGTAYVPVATATIYVAFLAFLAVPQRDAKAGQADGIRRAADGKPDLSGIWQVMNTAAWTKCYQAGVPRITYMPHPFQIVQTSDYIAILYEYIHTTRHIYVDGSPHPKGPIDNWWMGDSRARWEGNTLVVDVVHFTDQTWFDRAGNFHSDALHVVERFTPINSNAIRYEATVEDPKVLTGPWTVPKQTLRLAPFDQIMEVGCSGTETAARVSAPGGLRRENVAFPLLELLADRHRRTPA